MIPIPKRKHIAVLLAILSIILSLFLYCKPIQLSKVLLAYTEIRYVHVELGVQDGNASTNGSEMITLSADACENLMDIFSQYTYARTMQTVFSDGFPNGIGNDVVYIYLYNDDVLQTSIMVSTMDRITINEKAYAMSNSSNLIHALTAMMGQS